MRYNVNFAKSFFLLCRRKNRGVDYIFDWWRTGECLCNSEIKKKEKQNRIWLDPILTEETSRFNTKIQEIKFCPVKFQQYEDLCSVNWLHVCRGREVTRTDWTAASCTSEVMSARHRHSNILIGHRSSSLPSCLNKIADISKKKNNNVDGQQERHLVCYYCIAKGKEWHFPPAWLTECCPFTCHLSQKTLVRREPFSSRLHAFIVISPRSFLAFFAVAHWPCLCFPLRWWVSDYCTPAVNFLVGGENNKEDCARFSFHPSHTGISFVKGWSCLA